MTRMAGIILMITGIIIFVIGILVYNSSKKENKLDNNRNELEKVIEIAIADGVLTDNERKIIKKLAIENELDYDEIISRAETQMTDLMIDSETALIDYNKKNGNDFEKFIVQKFDKKYFKIKEWAGDKYVDGIYADTTLQPDLLLELKLSKKATEFSVECKWRQKLPDDEFEFAYKEQFYRYKNFEKERKIPVFIAIGIGGKGNQPENLYIVPLRFLKSNIILVKFLKKFEKKIESDFFFDIKTDKLI